MDAASGTGGQNHNSSRWMGLSSHAQPCLVRARLILHRHEKSFITVAILCSRTIQYTTNISSLSIFRDTVQSIFLAGLLRV